MNFVSETVGGKHASDGNAVGTCMLGTAILSPARVNDSGAAISVLSNCFQTLDAEAPARRQQFTAQSQNSECFQGIRMVGVTGIEPVTPTMST